MELNKLAAPPDHDENIALRRARSPFVHSASRFAAVDQAPDRPGKAHGELRFRAGLGHRIERRGPALDILALVRFRQIPELDEAGRSVREREMRRHAVLARM